MLGLIILAAGKGARLNSNIPKCMNKLSGKPMIDYVLDNFLYLKPSQTILVVGYKRELIRNYLGDKFEYVIQKQLLGTAHAAGTGLSKIKKDIKYILVTNSDDAVFYKKAILKKFLENHIKSDYNFSLLTTKLKRLPSVKKVIKRNPLRLEKAGKQKKYEVVCGAYLLKRTWLEKNLKRIKKSQETGEYYLTNLIDIAIDEDKNKLYPFSINPKEWLGVNTLAELNKARKMMAEKSGG